MTAPAPSGADSVTASAPMNVRPAGSAVTRVAATSKNPLAAPGVGAAYGP